MRNLLVTAACAAALLLTGCVTGGHRVKTGTVGKLTYAPSRRLPVGWGRVAVFFDPAHRSHPRTDWKLITSTGPERHWHPVSQPGCVIFLPVAAEVYGLKFKMRDEKSPDQPPESRTVTVLEKQRLAIPISFH